MMPTNVCDAHEPPRSTYYGRRIKAAHHGARRSRHRAPDRPHHRRSRRVHERHRSQPSAQDEASDRLPADTLDAYRRRHAGERRRTLACMRALRVCRKSDAPISQDAFGHLPVSQRSAAAPSPTCPFEPRRRRDYTSSHQETYVPLS